MFSNSTQYALRSVLLMSRKRKSHKKLRVEDISEELNIPKAFLSKILQQLSRNNLISSTKGRGGGFYLSEGNMNQTLMDIIMCIEGHNIFEKCILGLHSCGDDKPCYLHSIYKKFKEDLILVIKDVTIEDLFLENLE